MAGPVLSVLAVFLFIHAWKRWMAHARPLAAAEYKFLAFEWVGYAALGAMAGYAPMVLWSEIVFGVVAASVVFSGVYSSSVYGPSWSQRERSVHSFELVLIPVALATLGTVWPFAKGVSFLLNMVLPFSVKYLQDVCLGFSTACGGLLVSEWIVARVMAKHRAKLSMPAVVSLPLPAVASPAASAPQTKVA